MIEGRLLAYQRLHAAHAGGEFRVVNIEFNIGRELAALVNPEIATSLIHTSDPGRLERIRTDAVRFPRCMFANVLVNVAWRNGPVEDIHAGCCPGYPLAQRRATPGEERDLMALASERFALGMAICLALANEHSRRTWSEQVLPYGMAGRLRITPSSGSLLRNARTRP